MFGALINKHMESWVGWIAADTPMSKKVVRAFALLDSEDKGYVTIKDLETRARTPAFIKHHKELTHFYKQAHSYPFGSDEHREWLHEALPKMSAEELANLMAYLPQQAKQAAKPTVLNAIPGMLVHSVAKDVTKALNKRLEDIGAAKIDEDLLAGLIDVMGTEKKGPAAHVR